MGLFLARHLGDSAIVGIGAAIGTVIQIFSYEGSFRLREASLIGSVSGIPGGSAVFLLFTALIVFAIAMLGSLIGASFSPMLKRAEKEAT
ncbi:MAG: hypothetical protein QXQ46_03745 [Thermoplasmatales archaeon]